MNREHWLQIERLYHSALEQDPARLDSFLAEACQDDADLRREVESLLAQSGSTAALADQSAWAAAGAFATAQTALKPGETLGPYEILGLLGTGGMGEVYLAEDTRLGRKVAIKISHERFSGRFEREASAISALNHPNICTLYDVGPNYLVMELVEGELLRDWLKRTPAVERILEIAGQVLEALRAAHHVGIVHRDLKPQNIMVRFDGYVKVLDFGLAKRMPAAATARLESTVTVVDVTVPGQILGTVAYMSPEQILGQVVDERSDLFAFGIILYEMLTHQYPWPRTSHVDTMHAILHDDPSEVDAASLGGAALAPVLQMLLRKNPAERYASAEATLEALTASVARASSGTRGTSRQKPVLPAKNRVVIAEAYEAYLKGRYCWERRTEKNLWKSKEYYEQAIEKDPCYAPAWAGLAASYNMLAAYGASPRAETYPRAKVAATRALELDSKLAEAWATLARIKTEYEWDWVGAEEMYKRAIELNPNYGTAHQAFAVHLAAVGRPLEAVAAAQRAREIEPLSTSISANVGWFYYLSRQYDRAEEECRKLTEMEPNYSYGHDFLGSVYLQIGKQQEAIAEIRQAVELSKRSVMELMYLGHALGVSGFRVRAQKVLEELKTLSRRRYVPPEYIAVVYEGLGDTDATFQWFEKAYQERSMHSWVYPDPRHDPIRSDSRFKELMRRMGLPPEQSAVCPSA
jgi:serine/threonine protein kinase/Flp pilus assembly protein TadD